MHAIIIFFCMIVLVPLMWVILMSVKSLRDAYTGTLWPEQFDFTHYSYVFQKMPSVLHNFSNSIIVTLSTVVVTTVIAVLAGYALAHLRLPGAAVVGLILIATLFFPTRLVSIIGVYQLERNLGLINTLPGVILPYISLSLAFSIIIMRGIFLQVSPEMVDAARVDGASSWRTLIQIMLPLAANGIVVVGDRQFCGGVGGVPVRIYPAQRPQHVYLPGGAGDDLRRVRRVGLPTRGRDVHHGHHPGHPGLHDPPALVHEGFAGRRAEVLGYRTLSSCSSGRWSKFQNQEMGCGTIRSSRADTVSKDEG